MRAVVARLVARLDSPPNLAELAAEAGYSAFHFHRVFRGLVGEPVMALLRRLRLERAAILVRDDHRRPLLTIALECGYESHEAFTRAFRAAFGRSPSAFRRDACACVWLAGESMIHLLPDGRLEIPDPLAGLSHLEPTMNVRIEHRAPAKIAYVSGLGPYAKVLPESFAKLCPIARKLGLFSRSEAYTLAVCYDDPETTPPEKIRSEAAILVDESFDGAGLISTRTLPGGRHAVATYLGPYSGLAEAWNTFCGKLIPAAGLKFRSGESFEMYMNDPRSVSPEEIRTDIFVPVE